MHAECRQMEAELHIALYFQNLKNYILKFQKNLKQNPECSQLWNLETPKISIWNSLYCRLHKNNKCVDLRIVISAQFKPIKPIRSFYFYVVYNTKNFILRFYTFVDFIIVYILDFFQIFWHLKLRFPNFWK
jgi:hypothetical protein